MQEGLGCILNNSVNDKCMDITLSIRYGKLASKWLWYQQVMGSKAGRVSYWNSSQLLTERWTKKYALVILNVYALMLVSV